MKTTCFLLTLVCLLLALPAQAEVLEVESGYPLEVEDAYPLSFLGREFRTNISYERGHDGVDAFTATAGLEVSFFRNTQLSVTQPFIFGEVEPDGVGNTELEMMVNINQETLTLPAFSIAGFVEFPTNHDAHGVDPGIELLMSKTLPGTWHNHRLHANLMYQANDDVQPDERGGRYKAVLGYSTVVTNEILFVADFVREESMIENVEHNLAEVGLRWQVRPRVVVSGGVGFGFGDESPDVITTLGLQLTF